MDAIEYLYHFILLGAIQGILISIVILLKKNAQKLLKVLLASLFIIISFRFIIYPFDFTGFVNSRLLDYLSRLTLLNLLLVAPIAYLYILSRLKNSTKLNPCDIIHAIPFLYYFSHFHIYSVPLPVSFCNAPWVLGIFYSLLILFRLVRNGQNLKDDLHSVILPCILIGLSLSIILFSQLNLQTNQILIFDCALIPYSILTVLFYVLGFKLMTNSKQTLEPFMSFPKRPANIQNIIDQAGQLVLMLETDRLYLDPNLNLNRLARHSGLTRNEASMVINKGLNRTFNNLINEYRIDTVKGKLLDHNSRHLSIMGIARESGFRSKATFLRYFKEFTGSTPTEYIKNRTV